MLQHSQPKLYSPHIAFALWWLTVVKWALQPRSGEPPPSRINWSEITEPTNHAAFMDRVTRAVTLHGKDPRVAFLVRRLNMV